MSRSSSRRRSWNASPEDPHLSQSRSKKRMMLEFVGTEVSHAKRLMETKLKRVEVEFIV